MLKLIYSEISEPIETEIPLTQEELRQERESHNQKVKREYRLNKDRAPTPSEERQERIEDGHLRAVCEAPELSIDMQAKFQDAFNAVGAQLSFKQWQVNKHIMNQPMRLGRIRKVTKSKKIHKLIDEALEIHYRMVELGIPRY